MMRFGKEVLITLIILICIPLIWVCMNLFYEIDFIQSSQIKSYLIEDYKMNATHVSIKYEKYEGDKLLILTEVKTDQKNKFYVLKGEKTWFGKINYSVVLSSSDLSNQEPDAFVYQKETSEYPFKQTFYAFGKNNQYQEVIIKLDTGKTISFDIDESDYFLFNQTINGLKSNFEYPDITDITWVPKEDN